MTNKTMILVAGAGGFIGGHLIATLRQNDDCRLRAVDIKRPSQWFQRFPEVDNQTLDLRNRIDCQKAAEGCDQIFNLAADMGGMGFIENNKALCMESVLINTHLLLAAKKVSCKRFFFSSSACVYAADKQTHPENPGLKESDAYPAMPEDGYGWEKLFSERMCRHYWEDFGLETRVARYHNVYGPIGTWNDGREKAPAAICRKVIHAKLRGSKEIDIWGDGEQTRSFMYIDDCLHGTIALMQSDVSEPINLGSSEMVTVNQLVDLVEEIAGIQLRKRYQLDAPTGVRGRSSDNTLIQRKLGWSPSISLRIGMEKTYSWIYKQMEKRNL